VEIVWIAWREAIEIELEDRHCVEKASVDGLAVVDVDVDVDVDVQVNV
jgi:hypothetical protein